MKGMDNGSLLAAGVFALAGFSVTSFGADFYLKTGASDFGAPDGYTLDAAGATPATSVPGAEDEVIVPSGTFAIDVSSASFTTLSGVKRVRPSQGAVLEFTADEGVEGTFAAPINWNGDAGYGRRIKNPFPPLTRMRMDF